jgi:hypothetical protein
MFTALDPTIEQWLARRRDGQFPTKPRGYESLYLLAQDFDEFVNRLAPAGLEDV